MDRVRVRMKKDTKLAKMQNQGGMNSWQNGSVKKRSKGHEKGDKGRKQSILDLW